jgi:hypothetical protein
VQATLVAFVATLPKQEQTAPKLQATKTPKYSFSQQSSTRLLI